MNINQWIEGVKVQYHPDWIQRWAKDPFSVPPVYLELSPAGGCNHRCTFCAPSMLGYHTTYLDPVILAERFAEMEELRRSDPDGLGVKSIQFAGEGEPLLHTKLGPIYQNARKAGIDVAMLTNAIPLTEKRAYEILPHVNIYMQVSVNAGTAETYAAIHQTRLQDWDRLWKNLATAVRIKRELKSSCEIGTNLTVLTKPATRGSAVIPANWPEIELLVKRTQDAGLDYVSIKPYSQHPYSPESMALYGDMDYGPMMEEIVSVGEMLQDRYATNSFQVVFRFTRFNGSQVDRGYDRCMVTPTLWSYVQSDGVWISCSSHWTNQDFHLGNINHQTVKEIWFGERRRQHLKFMQDFDVSICRKGCHPDKENRFLLRFAQGSPSEQANELKMLASVPFPRRGNII